MCGHAQGNTCLESGGNVCIPRTQQQAAGSQLLMDTVLYVADLATLGEKLQQALYCCEGAHQVDGLCPAQTEQLSE